MIVIVISAHDFLIKIQNFGNKYVVFTLKPRYVMLGISTYNVQVAEKI